MLKLTQEDSSFGSTVTPVSVGKNTLSDFINQLSLLSFNSLGTIGELLYCSLHHKNTFVLILFSQEDERMLILSNSSSTSNDRPVYSL